MNLVQCRKRSLVAIVGFLVLAASASSAEDLCYQHLKSIVVDTTNQDVVSERGLYYDHIYQYVAEYPYWKYVGGGLIGIV